MKIQRDRPFPKEKKETSPSLSKKAKSFKEVLEQTPPSAVFFCPAIESAQDDALPSSSTKEKERHEAIEGEILSMPLSSPYLYPCSTSGQTAQIQPLSPPDITQLLEKVGAEMILMHRDGITKTELHISDTDASSLLKDCVITIEEYSSAPKIFNVKIQAPSETLTLLQVHMHELLAVFKERKFGFSINRVDTELLDSVPSFARKKRVGEEESEDKQDQKS